MSNELKVDIINLKSGGIKMPVADFKGNVSGKTLLVTAGLDGDEYASIVAAYKIIERLKTLQFKGRIIVLPIFNMPGFQSMTSFNPIDHKYPKLIFPGNRNGSQTEQMVDWLAQTYVKQSDFWLDLHGGALEEDLIPFVWAWEFKNKLNKEITENTLLQLKGKNILYEKSNWIQIKRKEKMGVGFLMVEAGTAGEIDEKCVTYHLEVFNALIRAMDMVPGKNNFKGLKVYKKVRIYFAKQSGIWTHRFKEKINKGDDMGLISDFTGKKLSALKAEEDGIFLWGRRVLSVKKGDLLYAQGY